MPASWNAAANQGIVWKAKLPGLVREGLDRLTGFTAELLKWNEKVNLTAITRPDEVLDKHLLDSLAVLPPLMA